MKQQKLKIIFLIHIGNLYQARLQLIAILVVIRLDATIGVLQNIIVVIDRVENLVLRRKKLTLVVILQDRVLIELVRRR
jgi:hypothetical protein